MTERYPSNHPFLAELIPNGVFDDGRLQKELTIISLSHVAARNLSPAVFIFFTWGVISRLLVGREGHPFSSEEPKKSVLPSVPLTSQYHEIIVPTTDTVRYSYLLKRTILAGIPMLMVGETGTGVPLAILQPNFFLRLLHKAI